MHARRTYSNAIRYAIKSRGARGLHMVQKQKACRSAALSKRRKMQEHCRAACKLESPVAADLLCDGDLLDPAALQTATQRWCDIAERKLHLAPAHFSWLRRAGTEVFWLVELSSCSRSLLLC